MPKQTFLNLPQEKRTIITNAAVDEFAAYGFEAASINRIVAASGIAKGSFYQYFEDKMDVFRHLLDLLTQEKVEFFKDKHPPSPSQSVFDYFRWVTKAGMEFNSAYPRMMQAATASCLSKAYTTGSFFRIS
ncbi:MAG: TetR/AcrR family transcriptional regulator [Anaerolineales bacterium]|uniref:TetR/AcrR family transcriptional regulator n=1 Tax=Candidatus Villigracilis proximus TaxID=3140683 RepID=UPI0031375F49|nr:TetR/AcrR family transcriptional regulator [Anaerolineales bacterium]